MSNPRITTIIKKVKKDIIHWDDSCCT